jgi:hypothetical protein
MEIKALPRKLTDDVIMLIGKAEDVRRSQAKYLPSLGISDQSEAPIFLIDRHDVVNLGSKPQAAKLSNGLHSKKICRSLWARWISTYHYDPVPSTGHTARPCYDLCRPKDLCSGS